MADRSRAAGPLGAGSEHGPSVPLPHVELTGIDSYRVVHDAVEDGVGDGVVAETAAPSPTGPRTQCWRRRSVAP